MIEFLNLTTTDIMDRFILYCGAVLCIAGWWAPPLMSTQPEASNNAPTGTTKKCLQTRQTSPPGGGRGEVHPIENHWSKTNSLDSALNAKDILVQFL